MSQDGAAEKQPKEERTLRFGWLVGWLFVWFTHISGLWCMVIGELPWQGAQGSGRIASTVRKRGGDEREERDEKELLLTFSSL